MFPRLPWIPLPTYGLMVALGFTAALILAWRICRWMGLPPHAVQDVLVWASLWGLVGAKLLLVVLEPRAFLDAPLMVLFQGGVYYGGFIAGATTGWLRARRLGLDPWTVADVLAPSAALAHAFGRVGCFLAGCCWGSACSLPWAVHFTDPRSVPVQSGWSPAIGVHPTQLYEAAGNLVLMALALAWLGRRWFPGATFWSYAAAYGAFRFFIEFYRGDERGTVLGVSTSQAVGLCAIVVSLVMLVVLRRASRRALPVVEATVST